MRIVADGVNKMHTPERSAIVITHYERLLDMIRPNVVHVLYKGRIVKTAGPGTGQGDRTARLRLDQGRGR